MKKIIQAFLSLSLIITLFSCGETKTSLDSEEKILEIQVRDSSVSFDELKNCQSQLWHGSNTKIYVLFGYNFNDEEFVSGTTALLSEKYGLSENGGQIIPVIFPKNFKHGEKAVTVDLYNILNENITEVSGFITLGTPENTYKALAKVQDQWQGEIPFPVVSLFPQDETLGIQDTSIIVIDKVQAAESEESLVTESEHHRVEDAAEILDSVITFIKNIDGKIEKDSKLGSYVRMMLPNKNIRRYTDSDSGLYAINHFVID